MSNLPTNYTDATWTGNKKYKMTTNSDGTVSFEDVTTYTNKENSFFGASDANAMNAAMNELTYKPGDSVTFDNNLATAGFVTNGGMDLYFTIPLSKPLSSDVSEITITNGSIIVRQATKYCYNSDATTWVSAKTIAASIVNGCGIKVVYTMSNSTNVTNNDAAGILMNSSTTITFS